MDISFSDRSTVLIFGGLAFLLISFVNIDKYESKRISFNVPEGNKKYLIVFGILIIIVGILLPVNNSEQQRNNVSVTVTNNNDITQITKSEHEKSIPTSWVTSFPQLPQSCLIGSS